MTDNEKSTTDQILDLLLEALTERQAKRQQSEIEPGAKDRLDTISPKNELEPGGIIEPVTFITEPAEPQPGPSEDGDPAPLERPDSPPIEAVEDDVAAKSDIIPEKLPSIHLEKMLFQLALAVFFITIVINVPFNRFGTNLARAMPDEQAIVVRDGLVLKGSGSEIYVIENNQKRWISSLDAFDYFGYRWAQVNEVEDEFLEQFANGRPIYVLLKCQSSPHIYALEDGHKRWINTMETFQAEGFVWEDVKMIGCAELNRIPDGLPIPIDAGEPPQPAS